MRYATDVIRNGCDTQWIGVWAGFCAQPPHRRAILGRACAAAAPRSPAQTPLRVGTYTVRILGGGGLARFIESAPCITRILRGGGAGYRGTGRRVFEPEGRVLLSATTAAQPQWLCEEPVCGAITCPVAAKRAVAYHIRCVSHPLRIALFRFHSAKILSSI